VVEWITIDLKARWRIVGYALKSQLHEVRKSSFWAELALGRSWVALGSN
jgi:hypothetical protein